MGRRRRGRLTPGRSRLAARYVPHALAEAAPFLRRHPGHGPVIESAALWGLVLAALSYPSRAGVRFRVHAARNVAWAIRRDLRRELGRVRAVPLSPGVASRVDPDPSDLEARLRRLPRRHAEVCRLIYASGLDQPQIGRVLGMCRRKVCQIHRDALSRLRETA